MLSNSTAPLRASFFSLRAQPAAAGAASHSPRVHSRTTAATKCRAISTSPSSNPLRLRKQSPSSIFFRRASTDPTSSTPIDTTIDAPPTSPTTPPSIPLTWNEYLSLRRSRRHYNLASSIATAACTTFGGISAVTQYMEQLVTWTGFDPLIIAIASGVSSAGVGWLSGPVLGSAVFRFTHMRVQGEMTQKEKDFFARIKKHRVDPSSQSMSNPVPDYYGEKIGSVAEYRNWLKDQRAFNKKRQTFL